MSETEVEHIVRVADIADRKRIMDENLLTSLPNPGQKYLKLTPEHTLPRADWIPEHRATTGNLKRKYCQRLSVRKWEGLGIPEIAVPEDMEVQAGDVIKIKSRLSRIHKNTSHIKAEELYPKTSKVLKNFVFLCIIAGIIIVSILSGYCEYTKFDTKSNNPTYIGNITDIDQL